MIKLNTTPSDGPYDMTAEVALLLNNADAYFLNPTGRPIKPIIQFEALGAVGMDAGMTEGALYKFRLYHDTSTVLGSAEQVVFNMSGTMDEEISYTAINADVDLGPYFTLKFGDFVLPIDQIMFLTVESDDGVNDDDVTIGNLDIYEDTDAIGYSATGLNPQVDMVSVGDATPPTVPDNFEDFNIENTTGRIDVAAIAGTAQTANDNGAALITLLADLINGGRLDLLIDAIKAKTDNLPAAPANDTDIDTQLAAIKAETALIVADTDELQQDDIPTAVAAVQTSVDAIKAKTDNLPTDPADDSDIDTQLAAIKAETALIVADTNELQVDNTPAAIAAILTLITWVRDVLEGDTIIDTTQTPWQVVTHKKGDSNTEYMRKDIQTAASVDITDDSTAIGRKEEP